MNGLHHIVHLDVNVFDNYEFGYYVKELDLQGRGNQPNKFHSNISLSKNILEAKVKPSILDFEL